MPDGGWSQCLPSELGCVERAPWPRPLPEVALPVLACGPRGILGRLCHHTRHPCHPGDSSIVGWQSSMREPHKIPCEMGTVCCSNALGPGGCGGFSYRPFPLVFKARPPTPFLLIPWALVCSQVGVRAGVQSPQGSGRPTPCPPPQLIPAACFFSFQISSLLNLNSLI